MNKIALFAHNKNSNRPDSSDFPNSTIWYNIFPEPCRNIDSDGKFRIFHIPLKVSGSGSFWEDSVGRFKIFFATSFES